MLSRALSLATVMLLIGCLAAIPVRAQNLDAGKTPSQIFSGTCTACHKAPRGLLKTVPASSLPGFLRQHYTTSSEMASQLSAFLIANGATDNRGARPAQQAKEARPAPAEQPQLDRFGRPVRPAPAPEAARPEAEPQQAAIPPGPDGRKATAKQKLSKRGEQGKDVPKDEPAKTDPAKDDASKGDAPKDASKDSGREGVKETAKETGKETGNEAGKDDAAAASDDAKSQSAKIEASKPNGESPALRSDPVPPAAPAPPSVSAAVSGGPPEPVPAPAPQAAPHFPPPPAVDATPPLPPVPPAGQPAPPISH